MLMYIPENLPVEIEMLEHKTTHSCAYPLPSGMIMMFGLKAWKTTRQHETLDYDVAPPASGEFDFRGSLLKHQATFFIQRVSKAPDKCSKQQNPAGAAPIVSLTLELTFVWWISVRSFLPGILFILYQNNQFVDSIDR